MHKTPVDCFAVVQPFLPTGPLSYKVPSRIHQGLSRVPPILTTRVPLTDKVFWTCRAPLVLLLLLRAGPEARASGSTGKCKANRIFDAIVYGGYFLTAERDSHAQPKIATTVDAR